MFKKGSRFIIEGVEYILTRDDPTTERTEVFGNVEIEIKGYFDVFKGGKKIQSDKFHVLVLKSKKP